MRDINMLAEMVGFLGDSMTGGTDYAAERNGKHKQALAAASKRLPSRVDRDDRLVYEALGFKFGKVDGLFMEAEFPEGWDTKPTDHYMYTHIIDEHGRRRGQYCYKPDFWDQHASLWGAERRFRCEKDYDKRRDIEVVVRVLDCGTEIHRTKAHPMVALPDEKTWETSERVEAAAFADAYAWLKARFPECDNPLAYWSLPDDLNFDAFPCKHEFNVCGDAGDVIVTFTPTGARGEIRFDESGKVRSCNLSALGGGSGSQDEIWRKVKSWASLIANQPKDPRPSKKER